MLKRWLSYLAIWLVCLVLFLAYRQWAGVVIFTAVSLLSPVSLMLSRRAVRSSKTVISLPQALTRGEQMPLMICMDCSGAKPEWKAKLFLRHSYTGQQKKIKSGQPLPAEHCGMLRLTVRGIYIYDYLGLFRFRLSHPEQLELPVRPEPLAPKQIPELGAQTQTRWKPRRGGGFSENHDLRLYRPGDSLQQIHWKLSAKTGSLILREPMEPLHSRLLLRLDVKGTPDELDRKLSRLLWLSQYLLGKHLPHHWQILSASGLETFAVTDEESMTRAMDTLLRRTPATEGSVLQHPANAAWWHYIGGDSHEES